MEERIKQNINRIKELTNELIEIYQKRAEAIEKENVDRIKNYLAVNGAKQ